MKKPSSQPSAPGLFSLLMPYRGLIAGMLLLTVAGNALSLWLPKIIAAGIDAYGLGAFNMSSVGWQFLAVAVGVFVLTSGQIIFQAYVSERVALDLRNRLAGSISRESFARIQTETPSKLLTFLTSDVDAVKMFVSMGIVSLASSVFLIIGASALLISINWRLALTVLAIIPLIGGTFFFIFSKIGVLFKAAQEVIDRLNKIINESIIGSALIRVLSSQQPEYDKFLAANTAAKDTGMSILRLFASMIPIVVFVSNLATLAILALGGHYVISGSLSLGQFAAFNSYVALLIFPIIMIGFMSNLIGRSSASYQRLSGLLNAPAETPSGTFKAELRGDVEVKDVVLTIEGKPVLKGVSLNVPAGTRTAIIGPTAAGKTQLLYALVGLVKPEAGTILYDGRAAAEYDPQSLHQQVGFVFQDSVLFNLSLRENIAFNQRVSEAALNRAIETAELTDFIGSLPEGLETVVSERGTTLSGGQKQRVMLARALALEPKVLLLDDFTARVDTATEQRIIANVRRNYPSLTLISVTQKVAAAETYEQIVVLMEGEVLASGRHEELLESSPEYVQIYESQRSTSHYELPA